mgnify:CR=1 FL=1
MIDDLIDATVAMFTSIGILVVILISAAITFLPAIPYALYALKAPIVCNTLPALTPIPFLYDAQSGQLFGAMVCGETSAWLVYFLVNTITILIIAILIAAFVDIEVPSFTELFGGR